MKNLLSNLMLINKSIIFNDFYIDDNIDLNLFREKIESDVDFINDKLNEIFRAYNQAENRQKTENFNNLYLSSLNRFRTGLLKLKNYIIQKHYRNFNLAKFDKIVEALEERLNFIKGYNYRAHIANSEKQYINENEYSMLFQSIEK